MVRFHLFSPIQTFSVNEYMSSNLFKKNSKTSRCTIKKYFLQKVEYICVKCGNRGNHCGESLQLEIDHVNGDRYDNRLENLRLLCPNCHSQQKTTHSHRNKPRYYCLEIDEQKVISLSKTLPSIRQILLALNVLDSGGNYQKIKTILDKYNLRLNKLIKIKSSCCNSRIHTRKVERPSKNNLEKLVWAKPTLQLAKDFGVSDSAIGKWCKDYGISKPSRGYWAKRKDDRVV